MCDFALLLFTFGYTATAPISLTLSLSLPIPIREIVRFVQGRGIEDGTVSTRDKLVREMCPVVERQSGPTIGTVHGPSSSTHRRRRNDHVKK